MKKNGFTLIELLAVIVILAIIALIATPIILGIINDARKQSNERSVELYASAVRNAIAAYQLTGTSAPTSFSDLDIQHDGNIVCRTEELYEDGSFYIADCTVNGSEVDYTYGEKQELPSSKKPQYYGDWNFSGSVGTTKAPENPLIKPPEGKIHYLGYDVENGLVSTAYACFVVNEIEYCLKATTDGSSFATNTDIIKDAFSHVIDNAGLGEGGECFFEDNEISCYDGALTVWAYSNGHVDTYDGYIGCGVYRNDNFFCSEA